MIDYSAENQISLFDMPFLPLESPEEQIESIRMKDVAKMRAKAYVAGGALQVSFFPVWNTQAEAKRAKKAKPTIAAQQARNDRRAQDKFVLYANKNFDKKDLILHLGYDDNHRPASLDDAQRDAENYIKRVNYRHIKRHLLPLRYLYVIEGDGVGRRYHIHMFISGDMGRDELENLWNGGEYPQSQRLRPKVRHGLSGLAFYITKAKTDRKQRWGHSRNLKLPKPLIADRKLSKRQAEKMAINKDEAAAWFAKTYKGYDLDMDSLEIKRSEFVAGVYIYARLYKREAEPTAQARRFGKRWRA